MSTRNPKASVATSRDHGVVAPGAAIGAPGDVVIHGEGLVLRAVDELMPNQKNVRTHSKRQIRELAATIKALGFIGAIIVDGKGKILAGHARHAAAKMLGMSSVPTICVDRLSDAQMRAFMLADNKFVERSGWDRRALSAELEELSLLLPELSLDLSLTGFEAGEIDILLGDFGDEKGSAEDQIPPPTAGPAVTRPGDLWRLGEHLVLCADARSEMDYRRLMAGDRAAIKAHGSISRFVATMGAFVCGICRTYCDLRQNWSRERQFRLRDVCPHDRHSERARSVSDCD
jgi:hypothetical protein